MYRTLCSVHFMHAHDMLMMNNLCYAVLCCAMLCYAMLRYAMLCYATLRYATLCYSMLCYAMLCYAMLCYAMLSRAVLCRAVLCCCCALGTISTEAGLCGNVLEWLMLLLSCSPSVSQQAPQLLSVLPASWILTRFIKHLLSTGAAQLQIL